MKYEPDATISCCTTPHTLPTLQPPGTDIIRSKFPNIDVIFTSSLLELRISERKVFTSFILIGLKILFGWGWVELYRDSVSVAKQPSIALRNRI